MSVQSSCRLLVGQHWHDHVKVIQRRMSYEFVFASPAACLVYLTWMVLEMEGKWLYSCCFVECCSNDLFNIACSILIAFSLCVLLASICCIAICRCLHKHNNTIMMSDTVLSKIYLSLYLKGLCVRGSWRPNRIATY